MKKCPFCKADIDDNARFCLYCMTPLVEKEEASATRRKIPMLPILIAVAAGFVLIVVLGAIMLSRGNRGVPGEILQAPPQTQGAAGAIPSGTGEASGEQNVPEQTEPKETEKPGGLLGWQLPGTVTPNDNLKVTIPPVLPNDTPTTAPSTPSVPTTTPSVPTTTPTTAPTTTPTTAPTTKPTTAPTIAPTTTPTTVPPTDPPWKDYGNGIPGTEGYRIALAINTPPDMYEDVCLLPLGENPDVMYIYATPENTGDQNYVNPGNEYVTGPPMNYSQNGIIYIPAYISAGKVIGVGVGMCEMVSVFLPETVIYLGKKAFRGNFTTELAYVHIASDTVDIHAEALPIRNRYTVVLRTSAQCKNSKGEYIKDIAGRYGCAWEEWNG